MRGSIAAPGVAAPCLDRLDQPAQVLPLDDAPHQPRQMVFPQQPLQVGRSLLDLAAVGSQQPRSALAPRSLQGLLHCLLLFLADCCQVLEQPARRLALVLRLTHAPTRASCMHDSKVRRITLTRSVRRTSRPCLLAAADRV